ncbi:MAG: restriction endonuclease [Candidatus Brocadiales bacterium]|nr:restriction endonuclease [Candidatus Brocadiales bacterium]
MKTSEIFEHQIRRIHELIERPDSSITWNDRIPDPDNPKQSRQIDITIRNNNKLTLIECRIHKEKQDVKWIEELIGRRASLKADAVIAVSASGFTEGAILKAKKFGLVSRDMISLTEEEISTWGRSTIVTLTFYEYTNICIAFKVPSELNKPETIETILKTLKIHNLKFYNIFETVSGKLDDQQFNGKTCSIKADLGMNEPITIDGKGIRDFHFEAKVKSIEKTLSIPSIAAYDAPTVKSSARNTFVEIVELGNFEITQSSNNVIIAADLFPCEAPENCHFRFVGFDFKRKVTIQNLEILRFPKMKISLTNINISLMPT